jgi:hypothetical protein
VASEVTAINFKFNSTGSNEACNNPKTQDEQLLIDKMWRAVEVATGNNTTTHIIIDHGSMLNFHFNYSLNLVRNKIYRSTRKKWNIIRLLYLSKIQPSTGP